VATTDGPVRGGHVVLCAGAGTERLWPHVTMRRVVHLRVTFAAPTAPGVASAAATARSAAPEAASAPAAAPGVASAAATARGAAPEAASAAATAPVAAGARSWGAATWADRSGRFGPLTYGVADGPGRFAIGLAELDTQPAPADPAADVVGPGVELAGVRARIHAYARAAFPGLGPPLGEVVRLLTVLPGDDEDAYVLAHEPGLTVLAGHNLFKLGPLLGVKIADAISW
jgi:sarcosine oxidase